MYTNEEMINQLEIKEKTLQTQLDCQRESVTATENQLRRVRFAKIYLMEDNVRSEYGQRIKA